MSQVTGSGFARMLHLGVPFIGTSFIFGRAMATRPVSKKPLPPALVKNAAKLAGQKHARLHAEARELVAAGQTKRRQVADAFYDIGLALQRLKAKEMYGALGYTSFAELCEKEAKLSPSLAERLIGVASHLTRSKAIAMGQTTAMALIDLAKATASNDTPASLLRRTKFTLPDGSELDTRSASAREIERAAKAIRQAKPKAEGPTRGRTTTPEERAIAARLEVALHKAGFTHVKVTAVASVPGKPAHVRIEGMPIEALRKLAKAIGIAIAA